MDINYNITTIYIKPNNIQDYTFIHFDSRFHLEQFIKINNNLSFGHRCCDHKGIKVHNISNEEINFLKKEFFIFFYNNFNKKYQINIDKTKFNFCVCILKKIISEGCK